MLYDNIDIMCVFDYLVKKNIFLKKSEYLDNKRLFRVTNYR